jgi:uncharacterized protein with HEPN domain
MPPDRVRVQHMLDATRKALEFTRGRTRADLDEDEMFALAVVRLPEIIGEAAKHVSEPTRSLSRSIPWRQIAGTRDRLTHGYFDVDPDIVRSILADDLPLLGTELERLIGHVE